MNRQGSSQSMNLRSRPEQAGSSAPREDGDVPDIFLSHSGKQKSFVEHLFNALLTANHTAYFDTYTIPRGSKFPDHIKRAVRGCKLGVVVLSEDFLTTKWPMKELKKMLLPPEKDSENGSDQPLLPKVLPLCYHISFDDLKKPENLSRWRSAWIEIKGRKAAKNGGEACTAAEKWEKACKAAEKWEKAFEILVDRGGALLKKEGTSEAAYITNAVHHICAIVPCPVPYDLSSIQGHQRLAQEVANMFDEKSACMIGLHGVGGLGKTTLCRSMVNYYTTQYYGRSCLIEFPSDGDTSKMVQECKGALKKLVNLSSQHLLNEVNSFEQLIPLMKDHVKRYDMFLAIDNVWESSREEVERLLSVGFSATTKILLTSRSEQVLKDLLMKHTDTSYVGPLPAPEHEEAVQIFKEAASLDYGLAENIEITTILERCRFNGVYHVLALKALAGIVKGASRDLEGAKNHLSLISNADLQSVDRVIRLNYENLPQQKKQMFLDIVVFAIMQLTLPSKLSIEGTRYAEAHRWLCILYKLHETEITIQMYDLALDGLIQIEVGKNGVKTIRVHDLFLDLARREVASSPRFLLSKSTSRSMEDMEWGRLERVILRGDEKLPSFFEKLQQRHECEKLQVLDAADITIRSGIHLASMASLAVLVLQKVTLASEAKRTFISILKNGPVSPSPGGMLKLDGLAQLQILWVESCNFVERITGLEVLRKLQTLHIQGCPCLKKLEGLSGLLQLEVLYVDSCENLKEFSGSTSNIESYWWPLHAENESPREVSVLSLGLKRISVQRCGALGRIPDVSGLASLESLELGRNGAMEEVGGECLSSTLKVLTVSHCEKLRKFPSLNKCVHLETLRAGPRIINDSLLCGKLPNLCTLVLEDYDAWSSELFNEQWEQVPLLQDFRLYRCASLQILEVGCLTNLRSLRVGKCEALEEIGDVSGLDSLEELRVGYCPRLKKVNGLVDISTDRLKKMHLWLETCGSLEESALPDASLLNTMQEVSISNCGYVQDWP